MTINMARESKSFLMELCIKGSMSMVNHKVWEDMHGPMGSFIKVNGLME